MNKIIAIAVALAFSSTVFAQAPKAADTKQAEPMKATPATPAAKVEKKVEKVLGPKEGKAKPTDAERKAARDAKAAEKKAAQEKAAAERKAKREAAAAERKAKADAKKAAKTEPKK